MEIKSVRKAAIAAALLSTVAFGGCLEGSNPSPSSSAIHYAQAFLLPEPYSVLEVRFFYQEGHAPSQDALDWLEQEAARAMGPKEIRFALPEPLSSMETGTAQTWNLSELKHLAVQNSRPPLPFGEYGLGDTAYMFIFYVDGHHERDGSRVRGLHVDGRAFIFPDTFREHDGINPTGFVLAHLFERSTLVHEFGHALGLVDCGVPMVKPHAHDSEPCHSSNQESVMYPSSAIAPEPDRIAKGDVHVGDRFDENDLADLRAFQASVAP